MKVLQINCVYRTGSTGKIVSDIHNELQRQKIESVVCYGRGERLCDPNVYKVSGEFEAKVHSALSRLFGMEFGFSPIATYRTLRIIRKERPDIVHLHCLNGHFINVYRLLHYLKKHSINTVLTLHAEIMHTAGCSYVMDCEKWKSECHSCDRIGGMISRFFRDDAKYCYRKMKAAFNDFPNLIVVGVSEWLTDRAKQSSVFSDHICFTTIHNGLDTSVFRCNDFFDLKKELAIPDGKKIILHVTPNFNSPRKGGRYVLKLAQQMPDYQFIIVGFNGDEKNLAPNIVSIRYTKSIDELSRYYSMADATLLTSEKETFSMIVSESLCCGTPVIGFKAGAPETIALSEYCEFVDFGDLEKLRRALMGALTRSVDKREVARIAKEKYSRERMTKYYTEIYGELYKQ